MEAAKEASLRWTGTQSGVRSSISKLTIVALEDNAMILFKIAKDNTGADPAELRQYLGICEQSCFDEYQQVADDPCSQPKNGRIWLFPERPAASNLLLRRAACVDGASWRSSESSEKARSFGHKSGLGDTNNAAYTAKAIALFLYSAFEV